MELGGVFFGLGIGHERGRYGIGQCPLHEVSHFGVSLTDKGATLSPVDFMVLYQLQIYG